MTINAEVLAWNAAVVADVRAHGGAVAHGPMTGASILILTTIGAKSGDPRARPLAHPRDGDRFVILASNRGLHTHPAW